MIPSSTLVCCEVGEKDVGCHKLIVHACMCICSFYVIIHVNLLHKEKCILNTVNKYCNSIQGGHRFYSSFNHVEHGHGS